MAYKAFKLHPVVRISSIHSLHYFETAGGFASIAEQHNFWEMVYVDRGEINARADAEFLSLRQGQCVLHRPNEYHQVLTPKPGWADFFVISFDADSPILDTLRGKVLTLTYEQKRALKDLLREGASVFGPLLDICYIERLRPNQGAPYGGEQLIELYLTQLLILILRHQQGATRGLSSQKLVDNREALSLFLNAKRVMHDRLDGSLRFEDICRFLNVGPTSLKAKFKKAAGMGVMQYYQQMRTSQARRMLRSGVMNASEIAEHLGYSSLQAFSRRFKQDMGVSPNQYVKMIADSVPANIEEAYDDP